MLSRKLINQFKTNLFDNELKDVINEKYYVITIWNGWRSYKKWHIIYLAKSKLYVKMIPKHELFHTLNFDNLDCEAILNNFYKTNKYQFLPEYLFETNSFLCFKYYKDYTPLLISDVINVNFLKISSLLNINLTPKSLELTPFFKNIIFNFRTLYKNEKLQNDIPLHIKELLNFKSHSSFLNYLCITPSNITLQDFSVKRNSDGEIIDWKYTDIDNWDILFPNYIFDIEDGGDDTAIHLEKINSMCDKPTVVLTYKSNYYNTLLIENFYDQSEGL